jgi:hypothetical protein
MALLEEHRELRADRDKTLAERNELQRQLLVEQYEKLEFSKLARERGDRLSDIPLPEVMQRMGFGNEREGDAYVYRDRRGQVAIRIEQQKAFDHQNQLICRNSLDLVINVRRDRQGVEGFTEDRALDYLRQEFGDKRASGAASHNASNRCMTSSNVCTNVTALSSMSAAETLGAGRGAGRRTMTGAHASVAILTNVAPVLVGRREANYDQMNGKKSSALE